jgi:hypothetical protein
MAKEASMYKTETWNWEVGQRTTADMTPDSTHKWQEEIFISPDGEKASAVVCLDDAEFSIRTNDSVSENTFEKLWELTYAANGNLCCYAMQDEEWTVVVADSPWEESYGFVWSPLISADGTNVATAVQQDMEYGMSVNGVLWENLFENANNFAISSDGKKSAAVVQVKPMGQADLQTFRDGIFSIAVDGVAWDNNLMNLWTPVFDNNAYRVAAQVRLTLYDYSIIVDNTLWDNTYQGVWEPLFTPDGKHVVAPVRQGGKWGMAKDGQLIWKATYANCWHHQFSADGENLYAIVAPEYGKFSVAVNDKPWSMRSPVITDLAVSPDGKSAAALANTVNKNWRICVNGSVWDGTYDMAWKPVFCPNSKSVAAKVRKNGRYSVILNGKAVGGEFDMCFDPIFNADGSKVLIRGILNQKVLRVVANVSN